MSKNLFPPVWNKQEKWNKQEESDYVEGMVPISYKMRVEEHGGQTTLDVTYAVTNPQAAYEAMERAVQRQQAIFPVVKQQASRTYAVPALDKPPEDPLKWLDRRINEMCKIGAARCQT